MSSTYCIVTVLKKYNFSLCNISPQLRDNNQLSRMCSEKETRLGEMERQVESRTQEGEDRRRMLEDVQSDKATISRALTQNRTLKDQLAELQNGFVKLVRLQIFWWQLLYRKGLSWPL